MESVKFGILGVSGHFLKRVVLPLVQSETVEVYAIASRSADKAKTAAANYSIPHSYGSYEDCIADKTVDAVYIPLPNNLHAEWIRKSADAGKHILCEKPITMNATEAQDVVLYASAKKVLLMEAFMYKFHPQWIHVKELLHSGEIGVVRSVHTWFSYANADAQNIRNKPETGGGALMDIGCYAVSFPRFLLDAEPGRVMAVMQTDPVFGTDILTSGILDFDTVRATFTVATQAFPCQRCWINGTDGVIEIMIPCNVYSDVPAEVLVTTGLGTRTFRTPPADQYGLQFEAFADAIRSGGPVPVTPVDAVNNMKVIDALVESAQDGMWKPIGTN